MATFIYPSTHAPSAALDAADAEPRLRRATHKLSLLASSARFLLWLLLAGLVPATFAASVHFAALWARGAPAPDALGNELWWLVNAGVITALISAVVIVLGLLQLSRICRWRSRTSC